MAEDQFAVLTVNGVDFQDWESVFVQAQWAVDCSVFRFTAAERDDLPGDWTKLQFKPGDRCTISLAGQQAINGYITVRQTAYDANGHTVMLQGKSITAWPAKSSVDHEAGNFDGMSFEQAARKVLEPYETGIKVIGELDPTPFEKLQNEPGEKIWDFLERIARPRKILMGSDAMGNFLLIGDHAMPTTDSLVEGYNILSCQCVIDGDNIFAEYMVTGQSSGSDESSGPEVNEPMARVPGSAPMKSIVITTAEQPVKPDELQKRAEAEAIWHEGTIIAATIVVPGWTSRGGLWTPGDTVTVDSPMAMLNGIAMKIETATFTQDSESGTTTRLDLKVPWALLDQTEFNVSMGGVPKNPKDLGALPPRQVGMSQTIWENWRRSENIEDRRTVGQST